MPSTAAFPPPTPLQFLDIVDYKEEVTLALSTARTTAVKRIQQAQKHYKTQYDHTANTTDYHVGQWVLVCFPADECGRYRKLLRPWHGSYQKTGSEALISLFQKSIFHKINTSNSSQTIKIHLDSQLDFIGMEVPKKELENSCSG